MLISSNVRTTVNTVAELKPRIYETVFLSYGQTRATANAIPADSLGMTMSTTPWWTCRS